MSTQTKPLTAEDLLLISEPGKRFELDNGELIEMTPPNPLHALIVGQAYWLLRNYTQRAKAGLVFSESGFVVRRDPDTVRAPDVAFVAKDRLALSSVREKYLEIAPDLVVEVVSPGDRAAEVQTKVREWFDAGVKLLWLVFPRTRSVAVYHSPKDMHEFWEDDMLDGGTVLPGFSCYVREMFDVE